MLTYVSAADVKACMGKVQSLRYAEEICYNDTLIIKPTSSGLEIGASNWMITGPRRSLTYLTGSIFDTGHAMGLDIHALQGNDVMLFSDFSPLSSTKQPPVAKDVHNEHEKADLKDPTNKGVSKFRYKFPVYRQSKYSSGLLSAQGLQSSLNISSSACPGTSSRGIISSNKSQERQILVSSSISSKIEKATGIELTEASSSTSVTLVERDKFVLICKSIVKAIEAGGSALIPINRIGLTLQLLEEISLVLQSTSLRYACSCVVFVLDLTMCTLLSNSVMYTNCHWSGFGSYKL
eukprot:Gb_33638 [translate_table: standard]